MLSQPRDARDNTISFKSSTELGDTGDISQPLASTTLPMLTESSIDK